MAQSNQHQSLVEDSAMCLETSETLLDTQAWEDARWIHKTIKEINDADTYLKSPVSSDADNSCRDSFDDSPCFKRRLAEEGSTMHHENLHLRRICASSHRTHAAHVNRLRHTDDFTPQIIIENDESNDSIPWLTGGLWTNPSKTLAAPLDKEKQTK